MSCQNGCQTDCNCDPLPAWAIWNILVSKGATFQQAFAFANPDKTPFSLTGYTFVGQIRALATDTGTPLAEFDFVISGTDGEFLTMSIPANETATIPVDPDTASDPEKLTVYYYDVIGTSSGGVKSRFFQGTATISPGVTK